MGELLLRKLLHDLWERDGVAVVGVPAAVRGCSIGGEGVSGRSPAARGCSWKSELEGGRRLIIMGERWLRGAAQLMGKRWRFYRKSCCMRKMTARSWKEQGGGSYWRSARCAVLHHY